MVVFYFEEQGYGNNIKNAEAGETQQLRLDDSALQKQYNRGDTITFDFKVDFITLDASGNTVSSTAIARQDYKVFINPNIDVNHQFQEITGDSYTFTQAGGAQLQVTYGNYTSNTVTLVIQTTQQDFTIYYVILSVVLLFIVGMVMFVKKNRSGKGFLVKKREKEKELVENYKKELAERKKKENGVKDDEAKDEVKSNSGKSEKEETSDNHKEN